MILILTESVIHFFHSPGACNIIMDFIGIFFPTKNSRLQFVLTIAIYKFPHIFDSKIIHFDVDQYLWMEIFKMSSQLVFGFALWILIFFSIRKINLYPQSTVCLSNSSGPDKWIFIFLFNYNFQFRCVSFLQIFHVCLFLNSMCLYFGYREQ